jgi:hypothetical protein
MMMNFDSSEQEINDIVDELFDTEEYNSRIIKNSAIIKEYVMRECLKRRKTINFEFVRQVLNDVLDCFQKNIEFDLNIKL